MPLGLNELLGFVRRCHSAVPDLSPLILPFNVPAALWRFICPERQLSMLARAQSIQDS
jgi:hypothetical protein